MRISACVIAKNEEGNLPLWLECMENLAEELVVVDTGSTDGTVALAKEAGAKTSFFPWVDDFSAAKNFALDQATGDWVFFLDADEYFLPKDCPRLRETVRRYHEIPDVLGLVFLRRNIDRTTGRDLGSSSYVIRCFRRSRQLRYFGRIHEELRDTSPHGSGRMQYVPDMVIQHTGYSPELMEGKLRQTIAILERSRREGGARPVDDVYFLDCYYGLQEYEKAIFHARRAVGGGVALMGLANRPTSLLILSLIHAGHPAEEVREELRRATERFPDVAEYRMFWGAFEWMQQDFEAAEGQFARGLEMCRKAGEGTGASLAADHGAELLPHARRCLELIAAWKKDGNITDEMRKIGFPF